MKIMVFVMASDLDSAAPTRAACRSYVARADWWR